jgi:hypothetical protein
VYTTQNTNLHIFIASENAKPQNLILFFVPRCSCRSDEMKSLNYGHQLLFMLQVIYVYGEPWWNDTDRENRWTRRKTCDTLSITNPTWTDPGANPVLLPERPATNRLNYDTASNFVNRRCKTVSNNIVWSNPIQWIDVCALFVFGHHLLYSASDKCCRYQELSQSIHQPVSSVTETIQLNPVTSRKIGYIQNCNVSQCLIRGFKAFLGSTDWC